MQGISYERLLRLRGLRIAAMMAVPTALMHRTRLLGAASARDSQT